MADEPTRRELYRRRAAVDGDRLLLDSIDPFESHRHAALSRTGLSVLQVQDAGTRVITTRGLPTPRPAVTEDVAVVTDHPSEDAGNRRCSPASCTGSPGRLLMRIWQCAVCLNGDSSTCSHHRQRHHGLCGPCGREASALGGQGADAAQHASGSPAWPSYGASWKASDGRRGTSPPSWSS